MHRLVTMPDNRFARRIEELDAEERRHAKAAVDAARASFANFEEKPDSHYHQVPGLTAKQTWARIAEELGRVSALTTLEGNRDLPWEVADIELVHRGIFEPVFGDATLGFRSRRNEEVIFPIVMGAHDAPHPGSRRGSEMRPRGNRCAAFRRDALGAWSSLETGWISKLRAVDRAGSQRDQRFSLRFDLF
jgi:hypothetical protein